MTEQCYRWFFLSSSPFFFLATYQLFNSNLWGRMIEKVSFQTAALFSQISFSVTIFRGCHISREKNLFPLLKQFKDICHVKRELHVSDRDRTRADESFSCGHTGKKKDRISDKSIVKECHVLCLLFQCLWGSLEGRKRDEGRGGNEREEEWKSEWVGEWVRVSIIISLYNDRPVVNSSSPPPLCDPVPNITVWTIFDLFLTLVPDAYFLVAGKRGREREEKAGMKWYKSNGRFFVVLM